jgi:DUF971 family protein
LLTSLGPHIVKLIVKLNNHEASQNENHAIKIGGQSIMSHLDLPPPDVAPPPTDITVHAKSRALEIGFSDAKRFRLAFEFLRIMSPSAEVRGHGPGQEVLQSGKREVGIVTLEPVGHYAVQPQFDDGHNTGIYSWDYLYWLGLHQEALWADYLAKLQVAGASRDQPTIQQVSRGSCAH